MNKNEWIIKNIESRAVVIPGNDIDTDRIIPARFMKCVTFDDLGQYAFYDARFNADGSATDHPLNDPQNRGAEILVVGANFGCGSSREHAPQALKRFGIRAIIGESFAEIFNDNCASIGLPIARAEVKDLEQLRAWVAKHTQDNVEFDLEKETVSTKDFSFALRMTSAARRAFLDGTWDSTASLLEAKEEIRNVQKNLPYGQWLKGTSQARNLK